mgnify:CR=1 FL=1
MDKNSRISGNFTVDEFIYSRTAIENGIDNMPSELRLVAIHLFITQLLQPLRDLRHYQRLSLPGGESLGRRCRQLPAHKGRGRRLLRRLRPGAIAGSIDR